MKVIIKNGCIDNNMNLVVSDYRNKNKKIYDFIFKLDNYLNRLEENLKIKDPKDYDAYIIITFIQIHNSYQSIIALIERGMFDDSQIIMRSLFDKMIKCLYVLNDNKNFEIIKQDDINQTINTFRFAINHKYLFPNESISLFNSYIINLEGKIKHNNGKKITSKSNKLICDELGIPELYFAYKHLSGYTHNQLFVPGKKMIINKKVISVKSNLDYPDDLYYEFSLVLQTLSYIIISLCKYISNKELEDEFHSIFESFDRLKDN